MTSQTIASPRRVLRRSGVILSLLALLSTFFVLVPASPAAAAAPTLLSTGPNAAITASAVDPTTGTTYLGGSFTRWGTQTGTGAGVALNGTARATFPKVAGGSVLVSISDGAGGFYIGGSFTSVGGESRTRLAHILSTGAVDPDWRAGANEAVRALALSGSTLYVGGSFTSVTSTSGSSSSRARLAAFSDSGSVLAWAPKVSDTVSTMLVAGDAVFVGGSFRTTWASAGGSASSRPHLASFETTGNGALRSWAPAADAPVTAMVVSGSTLYVGGSFTSITPVGASTSRRGRLAALSIDDDGTLASWSPSVDGSVSALALNGATMYVGGSFTTLTGGGGGAQARTSVGAVGTVGVGLLRDWAPVLNGAVSALDIVAGSLFVGGAFTSVTPAGAAASVRNRAASFALATGELGSWNPDVDGDVSTVVDSGATIYLGGSFSMIGGVARGGLAAIDASGALTSWAPSVSGGAVQAIAVADSRVFVGGAFTSAAGAGASASVRYRLAAFTVGDAALTGWAPTIDGGAYAFAVVGSTLYVGGTFSNVTAVGASGVTRHRLAAISTTGNGTVSSWTAHLNDTVTTLAASESVLYVGGSFSQISVGGGSWTNRSRAAAVNLAGNGSLNSWAPSFNSTITTLTLSGSTVYVGGYFDQVYIGGSWVSRTRLAAVTTAGSFTSWAPVSNDRVDSITIVGSTAYLGGAFTSITPSGGSATSRRFLAAIGTADAGALRPWAPTADGGVTKVFPVSNVLLRVIGSFTSVTGAGVSSRSGLADISIEGEPSAPGFPTLVSAGVDNLTITWAPPSSTWNPVTSYDVTMATIRTGTYATPESGSCAAAVNTNTCTVTGLSPKTRYFFKVVAHNLDGDSPESIPSTSMMTSVAGDGPGAPRNVLVTPGNTSIGVAWDAPSSDGGRTITGYEVCLTDVDSCETLSGAARSHTFTSLVNGESHQIQVTAITGDGRSASDPVTAAARTVPSAPALQASNPSVGTVALDWTAPESDGGSAVIEYRACMTGLICQTISAGTLTATFTGLSNISYSPTIVARNAAGNSSAGTASITPTTVPAAPTPVTVTMSSSNTVATVGWSGSTGTGGSAITGYTVCLDATCRSVSAATTSSQFTGQTNGVAHVVTVVATNALGDSVPARGYVTTNGTAVAKNATVTGNMTGWNFAGFDLTGTNFSNANLTNADFRGATINNTNFSSANLTGADFSGVTLTNLREKFRSTNMTNTKFVGSSLVRGNDDPWGEAFPYTILNGTDFTNADLTNQYFASVASNSFTDVVFTGAKLTGADLRNAKLTGFSFAGKNLTGTNFGSATLTNADFRGATINNTNFSSANLTGADFSGNTMVNLREKFRSTNLTNTKFVGTNLTRGYDDPWGDAFPYAVLNGTDFTNANLTNQNLSAIANNSFTDVVFAGATLTGTDLRNAKLTGFSFTGMDLTGTNFGAATLTNADFRGATINNTNFSSANLTGADFSGNRLLNLRERFNSANLTNTKFVGSDLTRSYEDPWGEAFSYATLNGTDFTNANLTNQYFVAIANNSFTNVVFTGATLTGTDLRNAKLTGFSFAGKNLTGTNFGGATLTNADFRGATINNTNFSSANLTGADFSGNRLLNTRSRFNSANLTNTKFVGSNLTRGNDDPWGEAFNYAILNGTDFTSANLTNQSFVAVANNSFTNVIFRGATLNGLDLRNAKMAGTSFVGLNLTGVNFGGATLTEANFRNTDLTNTDFGSTKLGSADFRGSTVKNTRFSSATLTNANFSGLTFTSMRSDQFTYADLTGAKFVGASLPSPYRCDWTTFHSATINGVDFTNANISNTCFNNVTGNSFTGVKFTGANVQSVSFGAAKLDGFVFTGLDLTNVDFGSSKLTGADFRGTTMKNVRFNSAVLVNADFSGLTFTSMRSDQFTYADLTGAKFVGASLPSPYRCDWTTFHSATINGVDFTNANISNTCFNNVTGNSFTGVKFTGANIQGSSFGAAKLNGFVFTGLNLTNVDFSSSKLTGADFRGTTMSNTLFNSAVLVNADFSGVTFAAPRSDQFTYVDLTGAKFIGATLATPSGCNWNTFHSVILNGTDFTNATLTGMCFARVSSSRLVDVNFTGASLGNTNFSSMNLGSSRFTNAVLTSATLSSANLSGITGVGARGTSITTNGSTQLPSMWRITSGTLYVTKAPSDAPTITSAVGGDGTITVEWTAPTVNTGDAITGYTVCLDTVCSIESSAARSKVLTSILTPGSKTVTVAANNAGGDSPRASISTSARTVPAAPVLSTTGVADRSLTLNWSAPSVDGGYPVTGYRACIGAVCRDLAASTLSTTFSDLVGGAQYTLRVNAINQIGSSLDAVTTEYPTPFVVPSIPKISSASLSGSTMTLSWDLPTSNGGSAITVYRVCFETLPSCRAVPAPTRTLTVTLTDARGIFTVSAVNGIGISESSRGLIVAGVVVRPGASLAGRDLSNADLSGLDLRGINLSGADLSGADLSGSLLGGANLSGANLADARLVRADLTDGNFTGATMTGVNLSFAVLSETTDFTSVVGTGAEGSRIVGSTTKLPAIWSLLAGKLYVMVEPSAPVITSVTQSPRSISVNWDAPSDDGGGTILGYRVCVVSVRCESFASPRSSATLSSITNGATYSVTVEARNAAGYSPVDTGSVTLPGAPGVPGDVRVVASAGALTVRWARPDSSGGSPITGYSVCAGVSCVSVGAADRVGVVSGLVNGQSYAVVVTAVSAYGTSVGASGGSVVPFTSPSAVSITSAEGTDRTITVGWSAGFTGGSALTGFEVCAAPVVGDPTCVTAGVADVSADITGLTNGVEYTVSVVASNAAGAGVEATTTVTPSRTPKAPKSVVAQPRSGAILLSWDLPKFDGGAPLTGYSVCLAAVCVSVDASTRSYRFDGLSNGTRYTVSVQAINANGSSIAVTRQSTPRLSLG